MALTREERAELSIRIGSLVEQLAPASDQARRQAEVQTILARVSDWPAGVPDDVQSIRTLVLELEGKVAEAHLAQEAAEAERDRVAGENATLVQILDTERTATAALQADAEKQIGAAAGMLAKAQAEADAKQTVIDEQAATIASQATNIDRLDARVKELETIIG